MNFRKTFLLTISAFIFMSQSAFAGSYLLPTPYAAFNLKNLKQTYANNKVFRKLYGIFRERGYASLNAHWGLNTKDYRPAAYMLQNDQVLTIDVEKYLAALKNNKRDLMEIYKLKNNTYNKLAAMAFGVYGVETKFGRSWKYKFKEENQWLVDSAKSILGRSGDNSRGLTQMKDIPDKIQENYPQITPANLDDPRYAAVATLGYLAEAFVMIKGLRDNQALEGVQPGEVNLSYITDENIFDYIPYVYSGRMRMLFNGPKGSTGATVTDNLYIKEMKQHMRHLYFMESQI